MKVKIKNFKNIYGINSLTNFESDNAIIYAPNGTAKTSLAKGLYKISQGEVPIEKIKQIPGTYNITLDGIDYTSSNPKQISNIIVYDYSRYENIAITKVDDKYNLLTMSSSLHDKYGEIYNSSMNDINDLTKKISDIIGDKSTAAAKINSSFKFFKEIFGIDNWKDIILFLANLDYTNPLYFEDNIIKLLTTDKISLFESEKFRENVNKFNDLVMKNIKNTIFDPNFTHFDLESLIKIIENTNFFGIGHKIIFKNVNEEIDSIDKLKKVYEKEIELLYGNSDVKSELEPLIKSLKKKDSEVLNYVINDPSMVLATRNIKLFKERLLVGALIDLEQDIKHIAQVLNEQNKKINKLMEEAENEKTKWENICKLFKSRFDVPFEISVKDKMNSLIGISNPEFVIKYDGVEIDENTLKDTLSTGEKRALTILYFLFDLNMCIDNNNKVFVILDDIVDSFDYRNKYAMIQYLVDLSYNKKDNITYWILTHNFDFYNTCTYRVGGNTYYLKKSKDEIVSSSLKSYVYEGGISLFSRWVNRIKNKDKESIKLLIALIPACRNLLEIKNGTKDENYNFLCNYLHYRRSTETVSLVSLKEYYKKVFNISEDDFCNLDLTKEYISSLYSEIENICSLDHYNDMDLENKILLSIGIRLCIEEVFCKYNSEFLDSNKELGEEFQIVKEYFSEKDRELINKVLISIPEFIHINSFMYEPLIDIPTEVLVNLYKEAKIFNSNYIK